MVMLVFYPFQTLEGLKTCGMYWKTFQGGLKLHSEEQQRLEQKNTKQVKYTETLGFEIL